MTIKVHIILFPYIPEYVKIGLQKWHYQFRHHKLCNDLLQIVPSGFSNDLFWFTFSSVVYNQEAPFRVRVKCKD